MNVTDGRVAATPRAQVWSSNFLRTWKQRGAGRRLIAYLMDSLDASGWLAKERKRTRDPGQRARLNELIAQETAHRDRLLQRALDGPWLARESLRVSREK